MEDTDPRREEGVNSVKNLLKRKHVHSYHPKGKRILQPLKSISYVKCLATHHQPTNKESVVDPDRPSSTIGISPRLPFVVVTVLG